jgi:hypothetical protein
MWTGSFWNLIQHNVEAVANIVINIRGHKKQIIFHKKLCFIWYLKNSYTFLNIPLKAAIDKDIR